MIRRVINLATFTMRDLGASSGTAVACLFLGLAVILGTNTSLESSNEAGIRAGLLGSLEAFALAATAGTVWATSSSIAEDRRSKRLEQWVTSPLTRGEYVAGKVTGSILGSSLVILPVGLALLWMAPNGFSANRELFAPRIEIAPDQVIWNQHGGEVTALFESRMIRAATLGLAFENTGVEPNLPLSLSWSDSRGEWSTESLDPLSGGSRFALREDSVPLEVTLRGAALPQVSRLRLWVEGPRHSWVLGVIRQAVGWWMLIVCAASMAVCFAVLLPEPLSLVCAGGVLGLGASWQLLSEVVHWTMDSVGPGHAIPKMCAAGLGGLLAVIPDLEALVGSRVVVSAGVPFLESDPGAPVAATLWSGGALFLAVMGMRRR